MTIPTTTQSELKLKNSLVENLVGLNEYERKIQSYLNQILTSKENVNILCQLDEVNEDMWAFLIPIIKEYWRILNVFNFKIVSQQNNNVGLSTAISSPETQEEIIKEEYLIRNNFSNIDLSALDNGSFGKDYLQSLNSLTSYSNFNNVWHPVNIEGIRTNRTRIDKNPYFTHSFEDRNIFEYEITPGAIPTIAFTEALTFKPLALSKTYEDINLNHLAISGAATMLSELSLAYSLANINTLESEINSFSSTLPDYPANQTNLTSLESYLNTLSGTLSSDYQDIIANIPALLLDIETDMNLFLDIFYYYFRQRSCSSTGFLIQIENEIKSIERNLDAISDLEKVNVFVKTHFTPTLP